eukprot:219555-Prorocentrum_minimum.AAC.1
MWRPQQRWLCPPSVLLPGKFVRCLRGYPRMLPLRVVVYHCLNHILRLCRHLSRGESNPVQLVVLCRLEQVSVCSLRADDLSICLKFRIFFHVWWLSCLVRSRLISEVTLWRLVLASVHHPTSPSLPPSAPCLSVPIREVFGPVLARLE